LTSQDFPPRELNFFVDSDEAGERLDRYLVSRDTGLSRAQIQKLIKSNHVTVNDKGEVVPRYKVQEGDRIHLQIPSPKPLEIKPQKLDLSILYEDEHLLVLNKQAGVVVHPGAGQENATLVHGLLHHCSDLSGIGGKLRPGIVHRLDKDTSGLLVVAKNDAAHRGLSQQFKAGAVSKRYLALVTGRLPLTTGQIDKPIGRHPVKRKKMSVDVKNAKPALTKWKELEVYPGASLVAIKILTGRTHQIRVHLESLGHPILGDKVYGGATKIRIGNVTLEIPRQMLHAQSLQFVHPITGQTMKWEARLPEDMQEVVAALRRMS